MRWSGSVSLGDCVNLSYKERETVGEEQEPGSTGTGCYITAQLAEMLGITRVEEKHQIICGWNYQSKEMSLVMFFSLFL